MRILLACLLLIMAGCVTPDQNPPAPPPVAAEPAPGCHPAEPVVVHQGGRVLGNASAVGCLDLVAPGGLEPTIGITSSGAVFYYPVNTLSTPEPVAAGRSRDHGRTWSMVFPQAHPYTQDPYLYVDPVTDRIFAEDLLLVPPTCGMLSFSDDEGATWQATQSGCAEADHVTIFAGPARTSSTIGYANVVYRCAINGGALDSFSTAVTCQRSIDGGLTWLPPGAPAFTFLPFVLDGVAPGACAGGNGHGAVGPDGIVYLPRGHCGQPMLAISDDEGMSWRTVQVSAFGNACNGNYCEHDGGFSIDQAGNLYYAFVAHDDRHVYLTHSTDKGATWSKAQDVTAPGLNEGALVQIAAGGPGVVAFVYMGATNSPGPPFSGSYSGTDWNGYMAVTYDALDGNATMESVRLKPKAPLVEGVACGPLRCGAEYDFLDIRIAPDGVAWAALVDGCPTNCTEDQAASFTEAVAGHIEGTPTLWSAADANGPYPGTGPQNRTRV